MQIENGRDEIYVEKNRKKINAQLPSWLLSLKISPSLAQGQENSVASYVSEWGVYIGFMLLLI